MSERVQDFGFFRAMPPVWIEALETAARHVPVEPGRSLPVNGRSLYALVRGAVQLPGIAGTADVEEGAGAVWGADVAEDHAPIAKGIAAGEALAWDAASLTRLETAHPGLREQLETRLSLRRRRREIEDVLRSSFLFRDTSPVLIRRLVDVSTLARFPERETVCRQGEPGDSFFVIVNGEVRILHDTSSGPRTLSVLRAGDCFGEMAVLNGTARNASAVTEGDAELLVVGKRAFDALAQQSRGFLRRVHALAEERASAVQSRAPEVVWIENRTGYPTETLARLVAQSLQAEVSEEAALVVLGGSRDDSTVVSGLRRCLVPIEGAEVERTLRAGPERYLICFAERGGEARASAAIGARISTELRFLETGPAPLHHAEKFVHDVWVGPGHGRRAAGDLRLPIDGTLRDDLQALTAGMRAALGRIARAITHRRVGVALSGGGAWGFGHCALLAGLARIGIPVDVLSGSSFGSVVSASFAQKGTQGLDLLVSIRHEIGIAAAAAMVSSWPLEFLLERHLGKAELSELDPCVLPVAVDLVTAQERVFRSGSVAKGVRASCAFPGVYGPALVDGGRYVDGALTNNVPVSVLRDEGCDFVIASTIMPPPDPRSRENHSTALRRAWAEISPIGRVRDVTRSLLMLGHSVSRDLAQAADVVYSPNLSPYLLNEWNKADAILKRAQEQVEPVLAIAARRYASL